MLQRCSIERCGRSSLFLSEGATIEWRPLVSNIGTRLLPIVCEVRCCCLTAEFDHLISPSLRIFFFNDFCSKLRRRRATTRFVGQTAAAAVAVVVSVRFLPLWNESPHDKRRCTDTVAAANSSGFSRLVRFRNRK